MGLGIRSRWRSGVARDRGARGRESAVDGLEVTYEPAPDFHGEAILALTVSDGAQAAGGVLRIVVAPVNDLPTAGDDEIFTETPVVVIPASRLLGNDVDVDGEALTITSVGDAVGGTAESVGTDVTFAMTPGSPGQRPSATRSVTAWRVTPRWSAWRRSSSPRWRPRVTTAAPGAATAP